MFIEDQAKICSKICLHYKDSSENNAQGLVSQKYLIIKVSIKSGAEKEKYINHLLW